MLPDIRRKEIVKALRQGTVPHRGIEHLAVGLDPFVEAIDDDLEQAALNGAFKAVRGDYGTGKTFFSRWVQHRAQQAGFATTEVQISATDTPLYRMEKVYRRAMENLQTKEWDQGAFRALIERWFYELEEKVLADGAVDASNQDVLAEEVLRLLEGRLADVSATQPQFSAALRGAYKARMNLDEEVKEGLLAWLSGQPFVAAKIKRAAGIKGDLDHFAATGFLRGLLAVLKQTNRKGLVLVLDEVETIQRMRSDTREKSLNALRQLIDEINNRRYPGLFLVITGTPSFFDGPHGVKRLPPLAQRLAVDFGSDPRFDNPRAVQIRLQPFNLDKLCEVGLKVRDLFPATAPERLASTVDDALVESFAREVAGQLGAKVGIAPRLFLKKLVDMMDRVDQFQDFDPIENYDLTISADEMSYEERMEVGVDVDVDEIELELE